ncbi:MAG: 50S ribosomal protein L21 [Rhodospirillales bacterium]
MFAVIRTGGKQHRVAENDRITVEKLVAAPGDLVVFDDVLMLGGDDGEPVAGAAVPEAARVFGRVLEQARGPKLIIFKKKRRKNHRRTRGHRQHLTLVQIAAVSADGSEPAAAAAEPVPTATAAEPAVAAEPVPAETPVLEPVMQE